MTSTANTITSCVNQWEHHEASFFPILSDHSQDPSGALLSLPRIEKIKEFYFNSLTGTYATLICQGTHTHASADDLLGRLTAPGCELNLFMCRYDATPNFRRGGSEYFRRYTVHNLRVRIVGFRELQTLITIDHETGHTDVKKVMKFVLEVVGSIDVGLPSTPTSSPSPCPYISSIGATVSTYTTAAVPSLSTLSSISRSSGTN